MIEFIVRFALRGFLMIVVNQSDAFPLINWRGIGRIQVYYETSTRGSCPNELTYSIEVVAMEHLFKQKQTTTAEDSTST